MQFNGSHGVFIVAFCRFFVAFCRLAKMLKQAKKHFPEKEKFVVRQRKVHSFPPQGKFTSPQ